MSQLGRLRRFDSAPTNGRNRRISPVAAHSGDRLLSEPIAGTQPCGREPLFMPHCRHPAAPPDGVDGWKLVKALDLRPADQLPDRTARHRASAPDAVAIAQRRRIGALVTALNEVWTQLTPAPRRLIQKVRRQRPCDSLSSAEWARENAGCGGVVLKELLLGSVPASVAGAIRKSIASCGVRLRRSASTKRTSGQGFGTSRAERAFRRHTDPCRPHACT
jgi:hypothetical protein